MASCELQGPWDYPHAVEALEGALRFGTNPSLDAITRLCEALGQPQDAYMVVQVAGTNGKTSTAWMIETILRGQGRRTGLYTSPHLERYAERIQLGGEIVSESDFALAVGAAADTAAALAGGSGPTGDATEFELITAAALWLFRERGADVAVLEVGLGGRWDATSVAAPAVSVVTGVGRDHVEVLGDSLDAIASEKAAIIRPASAPVLGPGTKAAEDVFLAAAEATRTHPRVVREGEEASPVPEALTIRYSIRQRPSGPTGATIVDVKGAHGRYPGLRLPAPAYQAQNLATAIAASEAALGRVLDLAQLERSVSSMRFPGRFEVVLDDPVAIVDGSHNPQAAQALALSVEEAWPDPGERPLAVLGILADKDAEGIVSALAPAVSGFVVTAPRSPRALAPKELGEVVREVTAEGPEIFDSLPDAIAAALSQKGRPVLITGSLTTAGQARTYLRSRRP